MFIGPCLSLVTQVPADGNLTSWRVPAVMCISLAGKNAGGKKSANKTGGEMERDTVKEEMRDVSCWEDWMRIGGRRRVSLLVQVGYLSINLSIQFFFFFFLICFLPHPLACSHLWFDSISLSWSGQSDCVHACAQVCDQRYITVANLLEIKSLWQTNLSIRTHSKRSGMERARERGSER